MFVLITHPKILDFRKQIIKQLVMKTILNYHCLNNESLCFFNRNGFISDNEICFWISLFILTNGYKNLLMLFIFSLTHSP